MAHETHDQSRRTFLGALGSVAAGVGAGGAMWGGWGGWGGLRAEAAEIGDELRRIEGTPEQIARDEDYWARAATAYTVDRSLINLNNGGVSPSPSFVQDAMKRHLDFSNQCPPYTMWRVLEPQREGVRQRLARAWGVSPDEIAITRNASESLQICQLGLDLKAGDEVLCTTQTYPRMVTTFKQRERREGIVLRQISIPTPCEDPSEIVRRFENAITPRTKMILCSHVINLTGQVLPVTEITALGRARNIPVVIDGAHALACLDFSLADLDVDYYGTSLHKWLCAPHGTGLLYVRKHLIPGLWPMMAAADTQDDDIRKFEEIGTHPAANALAIGEALTFHQSLGPARKFARLIHLRDTWTGELSGLDRVVFHTSFKPGVATGLCNIQIEGIDSGELNSWLWRTRRILCTVVKHDEFEGVRVSPHVYTTMEELGRLVDALRHAHEHGIT